MADEDHQKQRDVADRETARLWRAWRTVSEMLADRVRLRKALFEPINIF